MTENITFPQFRWPVAINVYVKATKSSCLYDPGTFSPCGKLKKYFQMRQLSENTFQSFNIEVYEKLFFQLNF